MLAIALASLLAAPALAATSSTPGAEPVAQLSSFTEAEAFLDARGIPLKATRQGAAALDAATGCEEYRYDARGQELGVVLCADAAQAAAFPSDAAKTDRDARAIVRGRVVFLVRDPSLVAAINGASAAPKAPQGFADIEALLAARGLEVTGRGASASNDTAVVNEYILHGGARVAVYRFDDAARARAFSADRGGAKAILNGRFVIVVPQNAPDAELVYDLLAAE
ncbi:MAG TPA: hypothetical protein VMV18_10910 [bacterium]|nr:hypothetical protein [bacterium]